MAYTRTPNTVIAGQALKQNPQPSPLAPAGAIPVVLDADIASTTNLGVVQVGAGLAITPEGILSTDGQVGYTGSAGENGFTGSTGFTGSVGFVGSRGFTGSTGFTGSIGIGYTGSAGTDDDSKFVHVKLTSNDYTATSSDYYIGATNGGIDITLPLGLLGRIYVIKNQDNSNVKVFPTSPNTIDGASSKTLGSNVSITVVFDGTRWQTI